MENFQLLINNIFVNQSKQDSYCFSFPRNISQITNEIKKCECLYDESFSNIIIYKFKNKKLIILYLNIKNVEFLNSFINDFKKYNILLILPEKNTLNNLIKLDYQIVHMYMLQMNNKDINDDLVVLKYQQYLKEDYYNIHQDCWYDLNEITKNENYKIYVVIYNNEIVGYADVDLYNDCLIKSLYFLSPYFKKQNINTLIKYIMKNLNVKCINIIVENTILNDYCLNVDSQRISSFKSFKLN